MCRYAYKFMLVFLSMFKQILMCIHIYAIMA